jgi:uncharacterized protein YbjT (DUF2867 family)
MANSNTNNVLVFGPTGGVARAAALEAGRRGAKVWLAMRDTSKAIHDLSPEEETKLGFKRVQADLSEPSTIKQAVETSGANAAFVYMIFGVESMRPAFEALKDAGVSYIVLLSSQSVQGNIREIPESKFIEWKHAQAEVALEETGISHTAIRSAYFASNLLLLLPQIRGGEVEVFSPETKFDYIVRADIGTVCGAVLAEPKFQEAKDGHAAKPIYLTGPQLLSQKDAFATLSRVLGKEIKIKEIPDVDSFVQKVPWLAPSAARSLALGMQDGAGTDKNYGMFEEAAQNMLKYAGREGTKFVDWLEENKALFA